MSTLASIRATLQIALDDAGATVWTTAELDAHIQRALRDLSHHIPRQQKTAVATVAGSRDITLALTDLINVVAVEWKPGQWPRSFIQFSVWGNVLTIIEDPEGDGSNCNIYWNSLHDISGTLTLPADHEETLILGAAWLACEQQIADASNSVNTSGLQAPREWGILSGRFRSEYEDRRDKRQGVRVTQMHGATVPIPTQSSDPGP